MNPIGVDVTLLDGKQAGTRNDWAFTVARMIEKNGCPVPGGVNDCSVDPTTPYCKIVNYLETNYGPGCCGNVDTWSDEKIVKAVCGSCHGIRGYEKILTVSPGLDMWLFDGKDQQDWEITVGRMMNVNGAVVPGGQGGTIYNRIVNWLVANAGSGCCGYIPVSRPDLIAQAACGTCHGIVIGSATNNKRLTRGMSLYLGIVYGWDAVPLGKDIVHWTKTVNRMLLRRLVTRGSMPDLEQKVALIDWLVQEANPSVYSDPGQQGLRDPRDLFMTYCHKCHGARAKGSTFDPDKQWVTNTQVGDPPSTNTQFPPDVPPLALDPGYLSMWWWPPAGDFTIMPYYLWNRYSYGFPDRRVYPDEWNMMRAIMNLISRGPLTDDTPYLPPEGDADGDGVIDYPMDTTQPPPPNTVSVAKEGNRVNINWSKVEVKDLNGYLVFYAPVSNCTPDCTSCSQWTLASKKRGFPDNDVIYEMPVLSTSFSLTLPNGTWCIGVSAIDYTCPRPRPIDREDPLGICGVGMLKTAGPINIP